MHKYLIKQGLLTLRIDVVATLCIIFLICIKYPNDGSSLDLVNMSIICVMESPAPKITVGSNYKNNILCDGESRSQNNCRIKLQK